MTSGHQHHYVIVNENNPAARWIVKALRKPRLVTWDTERVEASPYPYGPGAHGSYYLSLLRVLHRWTGLSLYFPDEEDLDDQERHG